MICCRLIIEGNAVYEIDEECMKKKQGKMPGQNTGSQPGKEQRGNTKEYRN